MSEIDLLRSILHGMKYTTYFFKFFNIEKLEFYIEREYVSQIGQKCGNIARYKNELEHKLSYYRNTAYRVMIKNELDNLDMSSCRDYYKLKSVIIFFLLKNSLHLFYFLQ
jgi:hypothetical protein